MDVFWPLPNPLHIGQETNLTVIDYVYRKPYEFFLSLEQIKPLFSPDKFFTLATQAPNL